MQNNYPQSRTEEFLNSLTHISAAGVFLYLSSSTRIYAGSIYALIFSLMFFISFLYHSETRWKSILRSVDQFFIYIAIGASGLLIPDSLSVFQSIFFVSFLSLSILHHVIRHLLKISEGYTIPLLYLANGIISGFLLLTESQALSPALWLGIGSYLVGFYFYLKDHIKYYHAIWHVMCSLGAYLLYVHLNSLF